MSASLALLGAALVFLGGLWLFAMIGPWWPVALVVAVVGCVLSARVIAGSLAGDEG